MRFLKLSAAVLTLVVSSCSGSSGGSDAAPVELGVGSRWSGTYLSHVYVLGGALTFDVTDEGANPNGTNYVDGKANLVSPCFAGLANMSGSVSGTRLIANVASPGGIIQLDVTIQGGEAVGTYVGTSGCALGDQGTVRLTKQVPAVAAPRRTLRVTWPEPDVALVEVR